MGRWVVVRKKPGKLYKEMATMSHSTANMLFDVRVERKGKTKTKNVIYIEMSFEFHFKINICTYMPNDDLQ